MNNQYNMSVFQERLRMYIIYWHMLYSGLSEYKNLNFNFYITCSTMRLYIDKKLSLVDKCAP